MKHLVRGRMFMPPMAVWFNVALGALCFIVARLTWLRGKKQGSRARRWQSVMYVALGLCFWFSVGSMIAAGAASGIWYALVVAAVLLVMGSTFVAALNWDRERRGNNAAI